MHRQLLDQIKAGDVKSLARAMSLIENEVSGYEELLLLLPPNSSAAVVGITGPPGAGKSTLVDGLIGLLNEQRIKVAVLCVDPSSPFTHGALLGDRIRMSEWYDHPEVFIRSVATRGYVGGLSPTIIELTDVMKAAGFDYIIIETVGVGQSEIDIASLADTTIVVLVPESGDEVQTMKAGLMEIGDIFVINKSDRPGAELFEKDLRIMLAAASHLHEPAVIKTVATEKKGIDDLYGQLMTIQRRGKDLERRLTFLAGKLRRLIEKRRMKDVSQAQLEALVRKAAADGNFNLYRLADQLA